MIKEFCAENFERIPEAIELGAERIELCDDLDVGGTTPTSDIQEKAVAFAHKRGVEIMCMIRPRGGSFVYNEDEKGLMVKQTKEAVENDVDGLVFGALTNNGDIDKECVKELVAASGNRQTVFHMAFDTIPSEKQKESLEWLIEQGVTRILTRGAETGTALENQDTINQLIKWADGRIEILPGGGVTVDNLPELNKALATNQFHGTKIVPLTK